MMNVILQMINFKGIFFLCSLALIIFFFFFGRFNNPKYKKSKNIRTDLIGIREIESAVIAVLESWNKKSLSSEQKNYSSRLLRKQEKHIVNNGMKDKSEMIWDIKVEGLNNFSRRKNKVSIEISFIAKYSCVYGDNYYLLGIAPFDFRTFMVSEETEEQKRFNIIKDVQRWHFIWDEGNLKADKVNLNF